MSIVWPTTLPDAPLVDGYSEALPDNTIRTGMDAKIAKVRKRGACAPVQFKVSMVLDATERAALRTFLNTTTDDGSIRFEWTHPDTAATIECRFVPSGGKMITFSKPDGEYQFASFVLEVMP